MKASTAFFHHERCLWHSTGLHAGVLPVGGWVQPPAGAGHAESPDSKRRFKALMDVSGLGAHVEIRPAAPATEEQLLRVHPATYLAHLKRLSDRGGGEAGFQAPMGPGSYEIAKLSAGLATAAVDTVLRAEYRNAYSLSRPPGHHCLPDRGMGFCLLANIAVAIEAAMTDHQLERVAVIDWDVHHGNGTQAIFYERADVLTISLHQDRCFPPGNQGEVTERGAGAGLGYNINIPLPPGSGDATYRYAMERVVVPIVDQYRPELLVIACGYDANALDPLARMMAHSETFRSLTQTALALAERHCEGRLVLVHEGGYSESYVPFCAHATLEALAGVRTEVEDPLLELIRAQQPADAVLQFQRAAVDSLAVSLGI